jgi:hypothetical protein
MEISMNSIKTRLPEAFRRPSPTIAEKRAGQVLGFGGRPGQPPPKIDGRRQFRGKPQLTEAEQRVLARVRRDYLHVTFGRREPLYTVLGEKLPRRTIERLIEFGYLLPVDPGLLPDAKAQTYFARLSDLPPMREPS